MEMAVCAHVVLFCFNGPPSWDCFSQLLNLASHTAEVMEDSEISLKWIVEELSHVDCIKFCLDYSKTPKNSETRKFAVIALKVEQGGFTL